MASTDGYAILAGDITADTAQTLASLSRLQADHALTMDQLAVALAANEFDAQTIAELQATVELQRAEIERLQDLLNPPPATKRVLDGYLLAGGGGVQCAEVLESTPFDELPAVVGGTDVGGAWMLRPDSWEVMKWNLGYSGRHVASITPDAHSGELILHDAPGSSSGTAQGGVYVLDAFGEDWNGPLVGSKSLYANAQNSSAWNGWQHGYGPNFEQRSVGRLTWRTADGSLVCGQFGYAQAGRGGVAVLSPTGAKRIIPGTENWACRAVEQLDDGAYLVSVEKAEPPSALPSPGGLWMVTVTNNALMPLDAYPDTPEHLAYREGVTVAAMRDQGIWRDGVDISFNLARACEWYSVTMNEAGDILAGCMNPKETDGRFWSFVELKAGTSIWRNLSPRKLADVKVNPNDAHESLNSSEDFVAPNRGNTLGMGGATVTTVLYRGDTPMCLANGIIWAHVDGTTRPAPCTLIAVNRDYDRNPDGYEITAQMDFKAHYRKPGSRWAKVNLGGGNDGAQARWVGHIAHYLGSDGTRQTFNADTGAIGTTTAPMPPHNPEAGMTAEVRAAILATPEVKQFGERHGTFALDAETLVIYGHGAAVSRIVDA